MLTYIHTHTHTLPLAAGLEDAIAQEGMYGVLGELMGLDEVDDHIQLQALIHGLEPGTHNIGKKIIIIMYSTTRMESG